jgi:hypothetical protein
MLQFREHLAVVAMHIQLKELENNSLGSMGSCFEIRGAESSA